MTNPDIGVPGVAQPPTAAGRMDVEVAALAARVDRIEGLMIRSLAMVAGLLLAAGSVLPYMSYVEARKPVTYSVASFGFAAAGFRTEKGTIEGVGVVFAVAFLGLLIVVVGAIVSLAVVGGRNGTRRSAAWITGIAIVLLIGVAGMWATVALASTADRFELHPGPLVLTLGAVLFAVVVWAPALRDLWVRR